MAVLSETRIGAARGLRRALAEVCSIDLRSLALLRIGLACVVLVDLALRARFVPELLSDAGVLPRALLWELIPQGTPLQLHALSGGATLQWLLLGAQALLAVAFGLGWYARAANIALWLLVTSLHLRHPFVLEGGDHLLRLLLFWCCLLPTGARLSLDARAGRGGASLPDRHTSVASLGILVQVAAVYFFAGVAKTGDDWWVTREAIAWVVNDPDWTRFGAGLLAERPRVTALLTVATLVFEWVAPLLIFSPLATGPLRTALVPVFWSFQLGLAVSMVIGLFPLVNAIAVLVFLPPWAWDRLLPRLAARRREPAPDAAAEPAPEAARWRPRPGDAIAALALVFVLILNVGHHLPALQWPAPILVGSRHLQLYQEWMMFAPQPRHEVPRLLVRGSNRAGGRQELLDPLRRASWEPLDALSRYYRFRYLLLLSDRHFAADTLRRGLARFACRHWNASAEGPLALYGVEFAVERRPIRSGQQLGPARTRALSTHACSELGA